MCLCESKLAHKQKESIFVAKSEIQMSLLISDKMMDAAYHLIANISAYFKCIVRPLQNRLVLTIHIHYFATELLDIA